MKKKSFQIVVSVAVAITFILFPISMFLLQNQDEFWFNIKEVMLPVALLTIAVAIVLFLVLLAFSNKKTAGIALFIGSLLAAGAVCYYIQSNYMASYLPLLTGDEIDWASYGGWGIGSLLLWIGVPVAVMILFIIKREWLRPIISGVCACLLGMETLVLGISFATTPINQPEDSAAYFSREGIYELSSQRNVVTFISDTFQGTFLNEILEKYPEWKEKLADFTYYDNTTGTSCFTYFSMAKLLTGTDFPIGKDLADGVKYSFENQTLLDMVSKNGYDISYYIGLKPTSNVQDKLYNYEGDILKPDQQAKKDILKLLLKSTMFQGMPHQLKQHYVVLTSNYSDILLRMDTGEMATPYVTDDMQYRTNLLDNGITAQEAKPRYVVQYLTGVHAPHKMNRDYEPVEFPEEMTVSEKQMEVGLAQLKLLVEYTDKLKEANLYDQTIIIFTADHGFDMRFYPVMLVKDANAKNAELKIDSTPLSQQEDYETLLKEMTGGKTFAEAVNGLNLAADRIRYALDFRSAAGYGKDTDFRSTVQISGRADDRASYKVVREEYALNDSFTGRYALGDPISHLDGGTNVMMYGSGNYGMYAHTAILDVWFKDDIKEPLEYTARIKNVTSVTQQMNVFVGEKQIGTCTLEAGEENELSIAITPDLIKENRLTLRFEAPDAVEKVQEWDVLEWRAYYSFMFIEGAIRQSSMQ